MRNGTSTSAATLSSHHQCSSAFATSPASSAHDRNSQVKVSIASARSALVQMRSATRIFARARMGIPSAFTMPGNPHSRHRREHLGHHPPKSAQGPRQEPADANHHRVRRQAARRREGEGIGGDDLDGYGHQPSRLPGPRGGRYQDQVQFSMAGSRRGTVTVTSPSLSA